VMDSGSEQTVFVALNDGYFAPRKVQLGTKVDNKYIVLAGLKPGERLVTSGNFLIDSESKLKYASGSMSMPGMDHGPGKTPPTNKPAATDHSQHQTTTPDKQLKQEDHSKHQPPAAGVAPPDHSKHNMPKLSASNEREILYWYDPMHPGYKADKPGKAPDCGMDLVPRYADDKSNQVR